jgi:hypothetical protein
MPIRAIAVAAQDLGKVFEKLQQSENARHFYRKSVEWFALLEQKGAISDYDRKSFENSRLALERLLKK